MRASIIFGLICGAFLGIALACFGADDAAAPAAKTPPPPATAEQRLTTVQKCMRENGIDFVPRVSLGDDGRIVVRVVPQDLFAK